MSGLKGDQGPVPQLISDKTTVVGEKMCNFAAIFKLLKTNKQQHEDEKDYDWSGHRHLSADDQLWKYELGAECYDKRNRRRECHHQCDWSRQGQCAEPYRYMEV